MNLGLLTDREPELLYLNNHSTSVCTNARLLGFRNHHRSSVRSIPQTLEVIRKMTAFIECSDCNHYSFPVDSYQHRDVSISPMAGRLNENSPDLWKLVQHHQKDDGRNEYNKGSNFVVRISADRRD